MPLAFYLYRDEASRARLEHRFTQSWNSELEYAKWLVTFTDVEKNLLHLHALFLWVFSSG